MKTLNSRTFILRTTSSSHFFSSSTHNLFSWNENRLFHFSSSSSSSSSSSRKLQYDDESKNVKVSVWWDFENCPVPSGVNVVKVAQRITSALRSNGVKGPITITAFGDFLQLTRSNQEALSSTGISLNHVPRGGKNSADRSLLIDLVYWVSQNPPPAHLFLISGDRDFANILHRLRMSNYNILLASTESAPDVLCSASSIMWYWNSLVRGESVTGKHFNQPPDGPYGSWYGHYKVPLVDPFPHVDPLASPNAENSADPIIDAKSGPIPKAVINKISEIMKANPKGMYISDLRAELGKNNVNFVDRDFFGHKKFSHMLFSLSSVIKVLSRDGGWVVQPIEPKADGSVECNSKLPSRLEAGKEDKDQIGAIDLIGEEGPKVATSTEKSSSLLVDTGNEKPLPVRDNENDQSKSLGSSKLAEEKVEQSQSNGASSNSPIKSSNTFEGSEKTIPKVEALEAKNHHPGTLDPISSSSSALDKPVLEEKANKKSEDDGDKSSLSGGFLKQIMNWFRFWRSDKNPEQSSGKPSEGMSSKNPEAESHEISPERAYQASENPNKDVPQIKSQAEKNQLFTTISFWDEMESFVCSPRGSTIISLSKTRLEMAEKLGKEGPSVLNTLIAPNTGELLHLTDLLISEKRWVKEYPSQPLPFKVTHPTARKVLSSNHHGPNGLSAIFSGKSSQSNSENSSDLESEKQNLNKPKPKNSGSSNEKPSAFHHFHDKMLSDCQKLVTQIVDEQPEGFNMRGFKDAFFDKYGYSLNLRMLGYEKLASLLQTMPGVKIDSTFIVPSGKSSCDFSSESFHPTNSSRKVNANELSVSTKKDDNVDDEWEELGPVSTTSSNQNVSKPNLKPKTSAETPEYVEFDNYNSGGSDEEFTDSDKEFLTKDRPKASMKSKRNEEDSSLLQILDSWYISKEGEVSKNQLNEGGDFSSHSIKDSNGKDPSVSCSSSIPLYANSGSKTKHRKDYSFVNNTDEKGKLIESILGSMKKSADSRLQN